MWDTESIIFAAVGGIALLCLLVEGISGPILARRSAKNLENVVKNWINFQGFELLGWERRYLRIGPNWLSKQFRFNQDATVHVSIRTDSGERRHLWLYIRSHPFLDVVANAEIKNWEWDEPQGEH